MKSKRLIIICAAIETAAILIEGIFAHRLWGALCMPIGLVFFIPTSMWLRDGEFYDMRAGRTVKITKHNKWVVVVFPIFFAILTGVFGAFIIFVEVFHLEHEPARHRVISSVRLSSYGGLHPRTRERTMIRRDERFVLGPSSI